jgi:outer membrane protein OmpA-like peptidoglycan-associated protein
MSNFTCLFCGHRSGKRRRGLFFLLLFLIFAQNLYADDETAPFYRELSLGLGADFNGYSIDGFSLGVLFAADYRFLPFLSAGLKSGFGYDFEAVSQLEAEAFARWYFWGYPNLLNGLEVFAQLEGGAAGLWGNNGSNGKDNKWSFSGALSAGARLKLPLNFYAEAYIRGGYPFIWSVSAVLGYTITSKPAAPKAKVAETRTAAPEAQIAETRPSAPEVQVAETRPSAPEAENPPLPESVSPAETGQPAVTTDAPPEIKYPIITSGKDVATAFGDIIFRDNGADFTDLEGALVISNIEILDRVAEFLKQNPDYKLRIEGYANPVQTVPRAKAVEEERFLIPISLERANTILDLLAERGISRGRLTAVGLGGKKTVADISDKDNWQKNRRAEFILVK